MHDLYVPCRIRRIRSRPSNGFFKLMTHAVFASCMIGLFPVSNALAAEQGEKEVANGMEAKLQFEKPIVMLSGSLTQFGGAALTGDGDGGAHWAGKLDGYLTIDASQIGFWEGLSISAHPEFGYGTSMNKIGVGNALPVSVASAIPTDGEEDFDLSLTLVQRFRSGASLTFGKINMLDTVSRTPLVGGGGLEGFMHIGMAAPPTSITPPVIFGGLVSIPTKGPTIGIGVWDPESAVNRSGLEHPFKSGVSGMLSLTFPVVINGKRGFHAVSYQGSTKLGLDFSDIPDLNLPPESGQALDEKRGAWMGRYAFQQYLWNDPDNPKRGWGIFGQVSVWDENPTPYAWSASLGITGSSPIDSRPNDRFGIGYYQIAISDPLRRGLAPIIAIDAERALELFYTFQVGERLRLTADLQDIDPVQSERANAVFVGLRAHLSFGGG